MTQPLSEEECRQIWDALDDFHYYGNGSYVDAAKKIDAVVASIAEERAKMVCSITIEKVGDVWWFSSCGQPMLRWADAGHGVCKESVQVLDDRTPSTPIARCVALVAEEYGRGLWLRLVAAELARLKP